MSTLYVKINNVIHICKNVDLKMKVIEFIQKLNLRNLNYQTLTYSGKILNEDNTLHSYGIKNEDALVLLIR